MPPLIFVSGPQTAERLAKRSRAERCLTPRIIQVSSNESHLMQYAYFIDFGRIRHGPEAQRNGTTAHNHLKPHYLAVVSRRIAHLKEKMGKSRKYCARV